MLSMAIHTRSFVFFDNGAMVIHDVLVADAQVTLDSFIHIEFYSSYIFFGGNDGRSPGADERIEVMSEVLVCRDSEGERTIDFGKRAVIPSN